VAKRKKAGILRYIKEAFLFRWNLLFFAGAAAGAILSPAPDVLLPLVAAAELTFLAGLTSLPRFQAAIDAKARSEENPALNPAAAKKQAPGLSEVIGALTAGQRTRFQTLRARCLEMRRIAQGVRGQHDESNSQHQADELRTPGLDRLLWVFLRLLLSQKALQHFLQSTDEDEIKRSIEELGAREKTAQEKGDERILRSVTDSIQTAELRLENYQKAESNSDFVAVELDRIEGKIQALSEMAVSHQDPDYISSQVDAVAEGMAHTEEAIKELHHITGLGADLDATPEILEAEMS